MDMVMDCNHAIQLVKDTWRVGDPEMTHFNCHKQGIVYLVDYDEIYINGVEERTARINAKTGAIIAIRSR